MLPLSIRQIVVLNREISGLSLKLKDTEREWPKKDDYDSQKFLLEEEIKVIQKKFVSSDQESQLLSFISSAGKSLGFDIKSFSPEKNEEYDSSEQRGFKYLPIHISGNSRYHNLALFFNYLQSSKYFFDVKKISIGTGLSGDKINMVLYGIMRDSPEDR